MGEASDSRVLLPELAALPGHLFWRAHARVAIALGEVLPAGVDLHAYAALLALSGGVSRSRSNDSSTSASPAAEMPGLVSTLKENSRFGLRKISEPGRQPVAMRQSAAAGRRNKR